LSTPKEACGTASYNTESTVDRQILKYVVDGLMMMMMMMMMMMLMVVVAFARAVQ
jgi:hypothetical protein